MKKIKNQYGEEFDFDACRNIMDDDICEDISSLNLDEQYFYDLYCVKHRRKFGDEFEFNKRCPQV